MISEGRCWELRGKNRGMPDALEETIMDGWKKTRGQDYKEKHKLDSKQISNSPC